MFEFIRTHQRLMQIFLLLLIVPSFVLVGVSSYGNKGDDANTVATVAGQKVTQQEWESAQRVQMDRFRQMFGAQFDQKMFETPEAKIGILENLVAERSLNAEVARSHLTITDATLQKSILEIDAFKKEGGAFDLERYKSVLAAQGMSPDMFDARMRRDLALQQLNGAIQNTAFAPRALANRMSDINDQEREVQELLFPVAEYATQVKVSDDMVKAYYDKNATLFQIPEQVKVDYVVFNNGVVEEQVSVSDAEVAGYYGQNQKRFTTEEQRQASHILVNAKKDAPAAEKAAAKAKAEAILAEVRKAPADFAKIAKTQSQDPSSAEVGGDLGIVTKGSGAFPKPLEDAVYKLKQGEVSNVIESEFGYHIITLTSLKPTATKPLDEVKGEITAALKQQKMSKKYSELTEAFTNTVYEQADSLKPVADKLKLKIETVANLSRTPSPALGAAPYNNPKFLKAIFSDDAIKNKRNTEAVDIGGGTLIAGRVVEFKPATKRPLAEVEAVIRQRVTEEEAAKLAKKAGEAKLAAFRASGEATGFGEAKVLSRTKQPTINPAAAGDVLKADVSKLPAYVGVDVPGQGYGIYRIGKVTLPAQPDAARRQSEQQQIAGAIGQQEMYSYIEVLKQKAKAKITAPAAVATATPDAK